MVMKGPSSVVLKTITEAPIVMTTIRSPHEDVVSEPIALDDMDHFICSIAIPDEIN